MIIPGIEIESRYHGTDNFTGAPLPGYGVNAAWLHHRAAAALLRFNPLWKRKVSLYVFMMPTVQEGPLWLWWLGQNEPIIPSSSQMDTLRVAHDTILGIAVDLTIIHKSTGYPPRHGNCLGCLWKIGSHTDNASGEPLKNRQKLRQIMEKHGFKAYSKEWWHFHYPIKSKAFDTPYGCFEPITWKEPDNWTDPSYNPPQKWNPTPCKTQ